MQALRLTRYLDLSAGTQNSGWDCFHSEQNRFSNLADVLSEAQPAAQQMSANEAPFDKADEAAVPLVWVSSHSQETW